MLKPNQNWAKLRPQKDRWPKKEEEYPFSAKKNTALQPSLQPYLPPSLFPSSFGRILPEGKIFFLTAAATDRGRSTEAGRTSEEAKEERPFKVRFRRLARMER